MKLFTHGRYATVVSTAALVLALGGTSYAAGMITGANIKDGTVTTRDVKDSTLKLRDFSAGAKRGLTGKTGPSNAYTNHDNGSTDLTTGTDTKVLSLQLNAGSYVVLAKATAVHDTGTGNTVSCYVSYVGGSGDTSSATPADTGPSDVPLDMQLAFTLSGSTEIDMYCNQSGGTNAIDHPRMTAIKLAALSTQ